MIRGIDLRGAVALNAITMIGIGPLITIPLVVANLHGSIALWAWIVGAAIACCDGLVYAELGSLYPGSGGTYVFLREAFGSRRYGRFFAFLFAWQFVISTPLLLASGYIGFAHYAGYFWSPLANDTRLQGIVAAGIGIVTLVLLYRPIRVIGAIGVALAGIAVATLGSLVVAGLAGGSAAQALTGDAKTPLVAALLGGLGPSLVIALYDYMGYGQATTVGDEIRDPARTLPRSILISVLGVAVLYVATQLGVLAVIPWHELVPATPDGPPPALANYVASSVVERVWGTWPARVVTVAVLITAFASTYGNLLGASRVPYAAARDGVFFRPFARLSERGSFPNVSLVVLGLIALPACFLSLGDAINALTAGLVIVQSIAQIGALVALRARGTRAPYRMWLYPLPALVALGGWIAIFYASGAKAIAFGLVSLAVGVSAFAIRSRRAREWPFVRSGAVALALFSCAAVFCAERPVAARAATWGHAGIVRASTGPVFEVDGRPFFLYGAAFFYDRLPRDEWPNSMRRLRAMGINTLDLYVPWNWHELSDGDFDFDGRTNPRRDLKRVLQLAREFGFEIVLRPGPVVRNEWRNGGYPAWLLSRPEYGMPLHDLLEGRYPPTATLQNARSDDAAAEWMGNATHMTYARRWLVRALQVCSIDADRIVAVALDDDQGAYIDNQTWPAPHFQAYIGWLRDTVASVTGPREPVFINTYQMKVTSSSPVWAMGNWYQSDAYALGEHDRAQLEFSTGLLHTRPAQPMMASEFQAGWLLQPDDVRPRPASPSNTALALATMFGMGVRGVVNFPAQDTLYPSGWEAPFANAFYAWDAALALDGSPTPREVPTAAFGGLVSTFGPELAASHVRYDAAIAYLGASVPTDRATNEFFGNVEAATIDAQRACRDARLSCALVDPSALDRAELERYPLLVVPWPSGTTEADATPAIRATLAAYARHGGGILGPVAGPDLARAFAATGRRATVAGMSDATFADDPTHRLDGFLTVLNYDDEPRSVAGAAVTLLDGTQRTLPPFTIPQHTALVVPVGVRLSSLGSGFAPSDRLAFTTCMPRTMTIANGAVHVETDPTSDAPACFIRVRLGGRMHDAILDAATMRSLTIERANDVSQARLPEASAATSLPEPVLPIRNDAALPLASTEPFRAVAPNGASAYVADVYRDGSQALVLDNGIVRVVVAPDAGARAFVFEDVASGRSVFTSVGAMRDDVAIEPPLSTTDRIAKYTHDFPAGTFNRPYRATIDASGPSARVTVRYDAPDLLPNGASFERTIALEPHSHAFDVAERASFASGPTTLETQRAVSVTSLSVGNGIDMSTRRILVPDASPFLAGSAVRVASGNAFGYYDTATRELVTVAWRSADMDDVTILERRYSIVARLTLARGGVRRMRYDYTYARDVEAARAALVSAGNLANEGAENER
jgi:amino acid transporter